MELNAKCLFARENYRPLSPLNSPLSPFNSL